MAERKLITPWSRITVRDQVFTQGIRVECHSSRKEQRSQATLECDLGYTGFLDLVSMAPVQVELGYDGDYDTLLTGYMTDGQALGPYRILDDILFLKRTYVKETSLDCCPQDIVRFGLGRAGIAGYRLSGTIYPKKDVVPAPRMNVAELTQEVGRVWGLEASFYFRSSRFFWGTGEEQTLTYVLEEGKNIPSFNQQNGGNEIKTTGAPQIHQGEHIRIRHRKFDGEALVASVRVEADETGSVRMYVSLQLEGRGFKMAGFLSEFVKLTVSEIIGTDYPHIHRPALYQAKVMEGTVKDGASYVTSRLLEENGETDEAFPAIPYTRTEQVLKKGDVVAVGLLHKQCRLYILGGCL